MEEINQESYSSIINSNNLISETNQNEILLKEIGSETISSKNFIEKNENEIKEMIEEKHEANNQVNINQINESKDDKDYPIITKLLNLQKLIQKELSTRKICKYFKIIFNI